MIGELQSILNVLKSNKIVDLSHTLEEGIPSYPTQSKFFHVHWPIMNDPSQSYQIIMHEHNGTHIDSLNHFIKGDKETGINELPLNRFFGRCIKLDFYNRDAKSLITKDEIIDWEKKHVRISENDIVIFNFGQFLKWELVPEGYEFLREWPGLSQEAAEYLVNNKISIVGTDAISIDSSYTSDFQAHYSFLGNNVLIMECLTQLQKIPEESLFLALPLKIKNGTASPIRAIAIVPN